MEKVKENLRFHVHLLADELGERSLLSYSELNWAAEQIRRYLAGLGYPVREQVFHKGQREFVNLIAEKTGKALPDEIIVIGAHYDTVKGTPGADDNASGVACLLELARLCREPEFDRTVRFVAFSLEEPPMFGTEYMGSRVYVRQLRQKKENVLGMLCLESLGYFKNDEKSQSYPLPFMKYFYPKCGNFIAVVGNSPSRVLVESVAASIKAGTKVPVETLSAPSIVPGIDLSDHSSFWRAGYPAVMITDTAIYRNPNYHSKNDTMATLDFETMTEVVNGLLNAVRNLAAKI